MLANVRENLIRDGLDRHQVAHRQKERLESHGDAVPVGRSVLPQDRDNGVRSGEDAWNLQGALIERAPSPIDASASWSLRSRDWRGDTRG